ncbi:serine hydroxymethyltransferase [Brachyspira aalborgi]|uniref:Serine hydroxymethyltransferase n=1 Tax=Brachyspira aalborgi TaxID=29522 RepID=A0A5C8ECC2_9SPIR|nr:serine hydroxymethyltransferase [Brachyspira aalborgi]TXJ35323.1 serine hydroxymethyltransferase [Brachyspira aalborgi]TXJ58879.1 serine hydroxymethyltransferase [Brachyspira aalborgi]
MPVNKKVQSKKSVSTIKKSVKKIINKNSNKKSNLAKNSIKKVVSKNAKKIATTKYYVSETPLKYADREIFGAIKREYKRELSVLELIASENIVSRAVMEAQGSIFTNKYAEGYPAKRYYGGCAEADVIENLAIDRAKKLFKAPFINVQPHSGSQANMGVYMSILQTGDTCLGLSLDAGGHLTHGKKVNFSGKIYNFEHYGVSRETMQIDYNEVRDLALKHRPKIIVTGGSAYPRFIDFAKFREIADEVEAYLLVDMAHIAGLVAAGLHPNPVEYAHFVTGTTHKTLRGPRGGYIISTNEELAKKIDKTIFPGIQGGPLMHVIAAKAVCFKEALDKKFIDYQKQVLNNAKTMANEFISKNYNIISGGTDTHLILVDVKSSKGITGQIAETVLDKAHITINKNGIPYDSESPMVTSGMRLGTPAITTRGLKEKDIIELVNYMDEALTNYDNEKIINSVAKKVDALCKKYPIYKYISEM